ncbi:uncharacterized protein LOC132209575 [Stegostoma tigrinum]|uniref:uncharacterized protein LOC132209575 n=1 Tax=Stegostoma tigrinum TaxID=3053191 RepID=UPI0028704D0F|nr:uncharacterized protein LOC132209575 [Stegostoma tigrinum]
MASILLFGLILSVAATVPEVWMQSAPPGLLKTECRDSVFWVGLNKDFLAGKFWQISVVDPAGKIHLVTPRFASQCGYTITVDSWNNVEFRASVLSCCVHIVNDEQFNLTIQIHVGTDRIKATTYIQALSCMYSPWAAREIFCEENYMQVSVQRKIPPIEEDYAQDSQDWSLILPEASSAESGIWQVVFHVSGDKRIMTVKEAHQMNYGINSTVSRILLRAPYHTNEAQTVLVQGMPLTVIRSSTFYKQHWMILVVDTAVACPIDGTSFSDDTIIWTVPRIFTPIVTSAVHQDNHSMGVNGIKLDPTTMAERSYTIDQNDTAVAIKVPIGAQDGYYKSHVVDGQYGIKYSINLFLENLWEDEAWGWNKISVIHPVTTPFIPQPLVTTDDTIPEQWLFNVSLGNFLPDVELSKLTLDSQSFPVDEESQIFHVYSGTNVIETALNRIFILEVPMESPVVDRKYIGDGVEQYTLDVIYTMIVVPENLTFTHTVHLIHYHKIACFPNGRIVITAVRLEALLGVDGKMMLKDKTCRPKESSAFQATFDFFANTCGTSRRFEEDYMIYENEVAFSKKSTSVPIYRLAVSCRYHVNDSLHLQFEHRVNPQPTVVPGYGPLTLMMQLATDVSYSKLYEEGDYPVVKYLTDPVYVEVQLLHNADPQIELFLQDCWATASPDKHSVPQWALIINSCENKADLYRTTFHPVTKNERVKYPAHFKRFEVQMFAFTQGNNYTKEQVYFHCSVALCGKEPVNRFLCPGQCIPRKQRIGHAFVMDYSTACRPVTLY